jgi:hypothetical protein
MLKQKNVLNKIVNLWDLNQEDQNNKLEILKDWETKLSEDEFDIILKICRGFNYYSQELTARAYKTIFENKARTINDFDTFMKESLFFPLRRKDRIESAVDMFSSFRLVNKIDANQTRIMCLAEYLKNYKDRITYLKNIDKTSMKMDDDENSTIENLQDSLKDSIKDQKVCSKIKKRIGKIKASQTDRQDHLDKLVLEFHKNYYSVKNIIIIDDFIGTGDSGVSFLRKIGEVIGDSKINFNLFLWVIETSDSGKQAIEKKAEELGFKIDISFYKKSIDVLEKDKIFSSDHIDDVNERIKTINKRHRLRPGIYCKNHAIASFVNAPNNNLTLLSENSINWTALFLRTKRNEVEKIASDTEIKDTFEFIRRQ